MIAERTVSCNIFKKLGKERLEIYRELNDPSSAIGRIDELMEKLDKNNASFAVEVASHEAGFCTNNQELEI